MCGIEKFSELLLLLGVILTVFTVKKGPRLAVSIVGRIANRRRRCGEKDAHKAGSSGNE